MFVAASTGTPNASGPFAAATTLHVPMATVTTNGGLEIFIDATNRAIIVYDAPTSPGAAMELFAVLRPSGGAFGAEINLSGSPAVESRLVGASPYGAGNGVIAYLEGPEAGPRDVFNVIYLNGGMFSVPANFSESPLIDSRFSNDGDQTPPTIGVLGTSAGTYHFWWRELLGTTNDIFYRTGP